MHSKEEPISQRFLVLGCGSIGKRHMKNLRQLGARELIAFDPCDESRRDVADAFNVETVARLDDTWARDPEVVIVAAPTSLHMSVALPAAQRGCSLFIEKPLSHNYEGIEALLHEVRERRLITLVGCNMRFHPGLATIKKLLEEEAVGRVIAARVEVGQYLPDWHPWADYRRSYSARKDLGGGVILDAIHEIDYIRWFLGEVVAASCMAGKLSRLEIDTEDTAAILVRFAGGAIGEIHLDYVQRAYSRTCQIIGEEGTVHWDFAAGQVRWYSAHTRQWKVFANPAGWEINQMYVDEMKHFLRCLASQEKPTLDVFEAAQVLRIALAVKASAQQQRWIEIGSETWNTHATL